MARPTCYTRIAEAMARLERLHTGKFSFNKGAGGYRLTDAAGGREYSPRLPGAAFALWLEAFESGLELASTPRREDCGGGAYTEYCSVCGIVLKSHNPPGWPGKALAQE